MGDMHLLKESKSVVAAWLILAGAVFYLLFSQLDKESVLFIINIRHSTSLLNRFLNFVDLPVKILSHGSTLLAVSVALFVIGKRFHGRMVEIGKALIIGFLTSGIASQILKHLCGRARPKLTSDTIFMGPSLRDAYHSFPSGHTAVAFCLASILTSYYPRFSILLYILAAIAGLERIEELKHFPSDVLAGALLGIISAKIVLMILNKSADASEFPQPVPRSVAEGTGTQDRV